MIVTVTLNPGVDRTLTVPAIVFNEVMRATSVQLDWGGKGFNVARALRALGEDALAMGFVGGATGQMLARGLAQEGVATDLTPIEGEASSKAGRGVSGRYRLGENPPDLRSLTFSFRRGGASVRLASGTGVAELACAPGTWQEGTIAPRRASWRARRTGLPPAPVAASGAWTDAETYAMRLCFYETPFVLDLACRFSAGGVTVSGGMNASFGPTELAPIRGQRG